MKKIRSLATSLLFAGSLASGFVLAAPALQDGSAAQVKQVATQSIQAPVSAMVNINSADAATLADRLNGIGLKKAQAIVTYREQNGAFKSADELVNVPGIGQATLEKNRSLISIN